MPTYTASELASNVGVPEDITRRFFRALGFPDAGDEVRYTEGDRAALSGLAEAVRNTDLDFDTAVRLVRAVGQNVARMSDWQVAALASRAEQLPGVDGVDGVDGSRRAAAEHLQQESQEALQAILVHSWRRHLDAALTRLDVDTSVAEHDQTSRVTVGFADLVNFSALSNELDSNRLGELVEIFEARCGDVVAANDGRMIKTIGDSVLFVADRPDAAMDVTSCS